MEGQADTMNPDNLDFYPLGVDSGLLWVGDPAYLWNAFENGLTWEDFCDRIDTGQPLGDALGVILKPPAGDGIYTVAVDHEEDFATVDLLGAYRPDPDDNA